MKYNPNHSLSTNFRMYEVARSSTATRLEIGNKPSAEVLVAAKVLAEKVLEPVRGHFGVPFSPQSWYRGSLLEYSLCGSSYWEWCVRKDLSPSEEVWDRYLLLKSHPKGEAADIEIPGVDNWDLHDWIQDNCEFDQLIREYPVKGEPMSGWVHVSHSLTENRGEVFVVGG